MNQTSQTSPFGAMSEVLINNAEIEISAFDGRPVLNCSQRIEAWERGEMTAFEVQLEDARYALHQVTKSFMLKAEPPFVDEAVLDLSETPF